MVFVKHKYSKIILKQQQTETHLGESGNLQNHVPPIEPALLHVDGKQREGQALGGVGEGDVVAGYEVGEHAHQLLQVQLGLNAVHVAAHCYCVKL